MKRTLIIVSCALVLGGASCVLDRGGRHDGTFVDETSEGGGGAGEGGAGEGGAVGGDIGFGGSEGGASAVCSDGTVQSGEDCDGDDLAGQTCALLGFDGGDLACGGNCTFDTSACFNVGCGNGMIDPGEACDGELFNGETCLTLDFASGAIACDPMSCQVTGCIGHFAEDFETMGPLTEWGTGGDEDWAITASEANMGMRSAVCGNIGNNEQTRLAVTLTFDQDGEISFWRRVSTEPTFDLLQFEVDGVVVDQWSGEIAWTQSTFMVSAGTHTFRWRYIKDNSQSHNQDTVWIDDVTTKGGYVGP